MSKIPSQIRQYPLIRLCGPDCRVPSHGDCNSPGKRPIKSNWQDRENNLLEVKRHFESIGNYGVVPKTTNDLVVIDADSDRFAELVDRNLPTTFTVQTGSGYHYYYRSDWNKNKRWTDSVKGEIKAVNSQVVGPGSDHPTGTKYTPTQDSELKQIPGSKLREFVETVDQCGERRGGGAAAAAAASPHQSTPDNLDFIRREDLRQKIAGILRENKPAHNDRCWLAGWLYGAAGLRQSEIVRLIMTEARWGDLDRQTVEEQVASIIDSSSSSRGTHYSNYSPDDSGKWSSPGEGKDRNKTMPSTWETNLTVKNGSNVCRVGTERIDPQKADMDSWETKALLFGDLEEDTEFGEIPQWETNQYGDQDTIQLGNRTAGELRLAAEALNELADKLEG